MIDVNKAIIARYNKEGRHFEILVDCDNALLYKQGKITDLEEVLASKDIFTDIRGAHHAADADLNAAFNTTDFIKIVDIILKKGEIQLTTEHKHKLREQKTKQIIALIHRNAINPQTNTPHPPTRIENALVESKIIIDEFKSAEEQLPTIIKKLTPIIPLKFETRILEIMIPAAYANQSFHILKNYGKLIKEQWNNQGSLIAELEIPAGLQEDLEIELNKLARGDAAIAVKKEK